MALDRETELALERGRALYNAARYYDAHEAWEEAWLREEGEARRLLQGLIQVAAGYFKAFAQGKPSGSARLLAAGLEKLAPIPEGFAALSLDPFRERVALCLAEVERWAAGERAGLDPDLAPKLERLAG
jgi:predicted metal-dependent hydrolase